MRLSSEELGKIMSAKTDEELRDIIFVHSQDYTADAIQVARTEFNNRHLESPPEGVAIATEELQTGPAETLGWTLKAIAFLLGMAFVFLSLVSPAAIILFVSLLLVNVGFVRKGQKRKASEWARWAFGGFLSNEALRLVSALVVLKH